MKRKAHSGPALSNGGPDLALLLWRRSVFAPQMLHHVFALRAHIGVELKRLHVHLKADLACAGLHGLLQGSQTDGTPGAGDVGHKVNVQNGSGHGAYSVCVMTTV